MAFSWLRMPGYRVLGAPRRDLSVVLTRRRLHSTSAVQPAGRPNRRNIGLVLACTAGAAGVWQLRRRQHDAVSLAIADSRIQEIEVPTLPQPSEFQHPYEARPLLWRVWFGVSRVVFIVLNMCPIVVYGIVDYMYTGTVYAAETRERFLASIVSALERGGCTALKFGQWISMRPDLFPSDIVERLACLRDSAPQHSMEQTRAMIAQSFGRQIEEIFEEFGTEPVASGSIAQVYKARLLPQFALPGGAQDVAVKVRHPTVMDESFVDMETLFGALDIVNQISSVNCTIPFAQGEFYSVLAKQMDFTWEAYNLLKFAKNFREEIAASRGSISFPMVSTSFLSESVLVESWATGRSVDTLFKSSETTPQYLAHKEKKFVALALLAKLGSQNRVFVLAYDRDNFVHGDLHAGNLLYDEQANVLTILDAGLVTTLGNDAEEGFGDFLRAMCAQDFEQMADCLIQFHDPTAGKCIDVRSSARDTFANEIEDVYNGYLSTVKSNDKEDPVYMGQIMGTITQRLGKYGICLRGDISACLLTISVSEGLLLNLVPSYDIVTRAAPYFVRYRSYKSIEDVMSSGYNTGEKAGDGTRLKPVNVATSSAATA